ncbi:MAG: hypothetical protein IKU84_03315 [Clostridia bacterium]|nr:hypothetical protein [Clostridia bacterium]
MNKQDECGAIFDRLMSELPEYWDGKDSVLYMRDNECRNWRQMEWPGWYFQFMCEKILGKDKFFAIPGPAYGNVEFDGKRIIPWDFKAHTANVASGNKVPTNGYDAIVEAIEEYGCVGFIVAEGDAMFDDDEQSFKKWHDELKGKVSDYEKERIARGARSRKRKAAFRLDAIRFVFVDKESLKCCGRFQQGMRNANGTPRNAKVMLDISDPRIEQYVFEIE